MDQDVRLYEPPEEDLSVLTSKLKDARIGTVCAMATSTRDQEYVSRLAMELPEKIVPAFGYHPWFVHAITTKDKSEPGSSDGETHYKRLFKAASDKSEVDELAVRLPPPRRLADLLHTLETNLDRHPRALLGEIGLDRVFRLPRDPKGYTREPDDADDDADAGRNAHTESPSLGRRSRPLTNLSTPIEHQVLIARAQMEVALRKKRSVSFHCVRAGGALVELLHDLRTSYPARDGGGLSKRERKRRDRETRQGSFTDGQEQSGTTSEGEGAYCIDDINIDLHSCTLSPPMITQIQRAHSNVYISFSIAINHRQKDLAEQIKACEPQRLLIESDWHSAEGLGARCWTMLCIVVDTLGPRLDRLLEVCSADSNGHRGEAGNSRYIAAAKFFHDNWRRFHATSHDAESLD